MAIERFSKRFLAAAGVVACAAGSASAQPANDLCSNATAIAGPGTYAFTTLDASEDEDVTATQFGQSHRDNPTVWFRYTPSVTGIASFSPCEHTTFPITLSAFEACTGPNQLVVARGFTDTCVPLVMPVTAGVEFWLGVTSTDDALTGPGALVVTESTPTPPPNDLCANAQILLPGTTSISTQNATSQSVPSCVAPVGPDVYFIYTPAADATVLLQSLSTSNRPGVLSVLDECGGTELACNNGGYTGNAPSFVVFQALAGEDYYIRFSARGASFRTDTLKLEEYSAAPNTQCANAITVSAGSNGPFTNLGVPAGEPLLCGTTDMTYPVYFSYTPTASGYAEISSNQYIAVLDGCAGAVLACNVQTLLTRSVFVPVTANQPLIIRLAGDPGNEYTPISLDIAFLPPASNDTCLNAAEVTPGTYAFNTRTAPVADGSASCAYGPASNDVWFRYNAAQTGTLILDVTPPVDYIDPVLSVFDTCAGQEIACNDDFLSYATHGLGYTSAHLRLPVVAGGAYLIRIATKDDGPEFFDGPGRGVLAVDFVPLPSNDACTSPMTVTDGITPIRTWGATDDGASLCLGPTRKDTWYAYTATSTGIAVIDTCASISNDRTRLFESALSVFDGCGGTELACNTGDCFQIAPGLYFARIQMNVTSGQQLLIRLAGTMNDTDLAGVNKGEGEAKLSVQIINPSTCIVPPPGHITETESCGATPDANDDCTTSDAQVIPALPATIHGSYAASSGRHDLDGYRFSVTQRSLLTLTFIGDYDSSVDLIRGECAGLGDDGIASNAVARLEATNACQNSTLEYLAEPGTYTAIVTHFSFYGQSCTLNHQYLLTIQTTSVGACCLPPDQFCTIRTAAQCATAGGIFRGDNTTCGVVTQTSAVFENLHGTGTRFGSSNADLVRNIGFTFYYLGQPFTNVRIYRAFGQITLGGGVAPANTLAPLRALVQNSGSVAPNGVYSRLDGTEPNRRYILSWQGLPLVDAANTSPNSVQVILHETTNKIEYRYGDVVPFPLFKPYAVGYWNAAGVAGEPIYDSQIGFGNVSFEIDLSRGTCACFADFNANGQVTIDDLFLYINAYFTGC